MLRTDSQTTSTNHLIPTQFILPYPPSIPNPRSRPVLPNPQAPITVSYSHFEKMTELRWPHEFWLALILICDIFGTILLICVLNICVEHYWLWQRRRNRKYGEVLDPLNPDADLELGLGLQNNVEYYEMQDWWVRKTKESEGDGEDGSAGSSQSSTLPCYRSTDSRGSGSRTTPPPEYASQAGTE